MEELLCKRHKYLFSFIFFSDMRKTHIMRHVEISWDFFTKQTGQAERFLLIIKNWMPGKENNGATD